MRLRKAGTRCPRWVWAGVRDFENKGDARDSVRVKAYSRARPPRRERADKTRGAKPLNRKGEGLGQGRVG